MQPTIPDASNPSRPQQVESVVSRLAAGNAFIVSNGAEFGLAMTTEYEQLLSKMVSDKKAKLAEVTGKKGKEKEFATLQSDIRFLEVELQRYQQGMALFRTKALPKVGRWGKLETEEKREEET